MNKEEIRKSFETHFDFAITNNSVDVSVDLISKWLEEAVIPQIIDSVLPEDKEHFCAFNDGDLRCECMDQCIKQIKQKAEDMYGVEIK